MGTGALLAFGFVGYYLAPQRSRGKTFLMSDTVPAAKPSARRNLYSFGLTSFFNDTASEMAYWVLPAFLVSLGAGPAQLGVIEGIAESVASFAKLFSGYLADRTERRKPLVVGGYFVANAVKPLLAMVTSWWHILLIRFADRLAKGVRGAPRDVMVAESVGKERLGSAVPGALSVLVAVFGIRETEKSHFSQNQKEKGRPTSIAVPTRSAGLSGSFYLVLVAVTLFSLGNSSDMFLVMRAQNVGIGVALAPLLGLVFNLTYTLASWPAGWLSDHVSRPGIAAVGYLIFAGVYFVFGRAPSVMAIWITMAVYGLYYALTQPVLKALVVDTVKLEIRGRALGIYFFATSVATLAASLITGELWKRFGASVPFYLSAALALLSALLLGFTPRLGSQLPVGSR